MVHVMPPRSGWLRLIEDAQQDFDADGESAEIKRVGRSKLII